MPIQFLVRSLPNIGEGRFFDIYRAVEKFRPGEKKLKDAKLGSIGIRGLVPNNRMPKEGDKFTMFHHSVEGIIKYGALNMETCFHVVEEEDRIYFEDEDGNGRYILVSCHMN